MVSFNNSIVLSNIQCCERVQLYCYSNSTTESDKYLIWPNGRRYQPDYHYYSYMSIYHRTPSGMYIQSYSNHYPENGIYTCQLQDSNENMVDISFGLYSSRPREYTNIYAISRLQCNPFIYPFCTTCRTTQYNSIGVHRPGV